MARALVICGLSALLAGCSDGPVDHAAACVSPETKTGLEGAFHRMWSPIPDVATARIKLSGAVLDSYDPATGRSVCRATVSFAMHPGPFARGVEARYSMAPLADGSGVEYRWLGTMEDLVPLLATVGDAPPIATAAPEPAKVDAPPPSEALVAPALEEQR